MKILQICSLHLSDVTTLPWKVQKSYFSTLDYLRYLRRKQMATIVLQVLAVYLLLFSAFY